LNGRVSLTEILLGLVIAVAVFLFLWCALVRAIIVLFDLAPSNFWERFALAVLGLVLTTLVLSVPTEEAR